MQRLEVSGAVRLIYVSLGVKRLILCYGLRIFLIWGCVREKCLGNSVYYPYSEPYEHYLCS